MAIEIGGPRPGDGGWIVGVHAAHYAATQGYDAAFEALVARVVADVLTTDEPERERIWIARDGPSPVGSILCRRASETEARLSLFYVVDSVQGQGVGRELLSRCIGFAREAGYRSMVLNTARSQMRGRALYAKAGFVCEASILTEAFGSQFTKETWRLTL